jgi:GT2 family glycosyltransferase
MAAAVMTVSDSPVVSVCIANYNGIALIDACLRSVLAQDCKFPVEIIVHDDASKDDSVAHIRVRYPDVILIESVENVGFCVSNNRMAAIANGTYLLLLNNDAELFPNALRILHEAAIANAQTAILGLPQYDADTGDLIDRGSLFDPFLNPFPNLDPQRKDAGMIIGACLWMPVMLWNECGGFPEWFGSMAEDMYLCCVARLWGHPVCVLPDSGFRHWVGMSFGGGKVKNNQLVTSRKRRALSERNKSFVMAITYPSILFHLIFPLHLVLLVTEGLMLTLIKCELKTFKEVYLNCFSALWRERSRLVRLRREVQAHRKISRLNFLAVFTPVPHKLRMVIRHGMPKIN